MRQDDVRKLKPGLYRIFWQVGEGESLAAVGTFPNGQHWLAPCNWVRFDLREDMMVKHWRTVDRVEPIDPNDERSRGASDPKL